MGAPWNMLARECAKPEYWVPAMGWQPTNVQLRPSAMAKHFSHMTRFTPTASMTMAPGETRSAFLCSQSMENWG